jgi:HK97 gp10 family phage protein
MPVKGFFNFSGLDEFLHLVERAGLDIDQAAIEAVEIASRPIEEEMHKKIAPHKLTGTTEATIFMTPVQSVGHYHFVQLGAGMEGDSATKYLEFGTAYMEAKPFVRPAIFNYRNRWRNAIKAHLKSYMGMDFP